MSTVRFYKSTNGGTSFQEITNGIGEEGYWLTPYIMDRRTITSFYCGTSKLYKSTNGGTNWTR